MSGARVLRDRAAIIAALAVRSIEHHGSTPELLDAISTLWTHANEARRESDASLSAARELARLRRRGRACVTEIARALRAARRAGNDLDAGILRGQIERYLGALAPDLIAVENEVYARAEAVARQVEPFEQAVAVVLRHVRRVA